MTATTIHGVESVTIFQETGGTKDYEFTKISVFDKNGTKLHELELFTRGAGTKLTIEKTTDRFGYPDEKEED